MVKLKGSAKAVWWIVFTNYVGKGMEDKIAVEERELRALYLLLLKHYKKRVDRIWIKKIKEARQNYLKCKKHCKGCDYNEGWNDCVDYLLKEGKFK